MMSRVYDRRISSGLDGSIGKWVRIDLSGGYSGSQFFSSHDEGDIDTSPMTYIVDLPLMLPWFRHWFVPSVYLLGIFTGLLIAGNS
jgi:hypothetical protein